MSPLKNKISVLLHTSNRPDFLERVLSYLSRSEELRQLPIFLLEGSDDPHWPQAQKVAGQFPSLGITVVHRPRSVPFQERMLAGAEQCSTPYVLLAADDDFYLPGWLPDAVAQLDTEPNLSAVYGHNLFFELEAYETAGRLIEYFVPRRRVPSAVWVEQELPEQRIAAVSRGLHEPATPSWYSLQRVEAVRDSCRIAIEAGAKQDYLEYLHFFCQLALGKVRMMDRIVLARQVNWDARHMLPPPAVAARQIDRVVPYCAKYLETVAGIAPADASRISRDFFAGILSESRRSHSTAIKIRTAIGRIPAVAKARERLRSNPQKFADGYPDPRFPPIPAVEDDDPIVQLIRRETAPRP